MCVVAALCIAAPVVAIAATGFKTGRYSGETSQHQKLVVSLTHATGCTAKTENTVTYCLGTVSQAYLTLKCPDGTKSNSYIDIEGSLSGGVLSYTERGSSETVDHVYLRDKTSGTITGLIEYSSAESIEGTGPVCKSGKVTFILHHG